MAKIYTSTNISQESKKKKKLLQANNQSRELQIYQLKITKKCLHQIATLVQRM